LYYAYYYRPTHNIDTNGQQFRYSYFPGYKMIARATVEYEHYYELPENFIIRYFSIEKLINIVS